MTTREKVLRVLDENQWAIMAAPSDRVDLADKIAAALERNDAADIAGRVSALRLKYLNWTEVGMIDLMDAIIGNMERK